MPAASAVVTICLAGYSRLSLGHRLNQDLSIAEQIIKSTAQDWIAGAVRNCGCFNKGCCRNAADGSLLNCVGKHLGSWFIAEDRYHCRGVNNHFGKPSSS